MHVWGLYRRYHSQWIAFINSGHDSSIGVESCIFRLQHDVLASVQVIIWYWSIINLALWVLHGLHLILCLLLNRLSIWNLLLLTVEIRRYHISSRSSSGNLLLFLVFFIAAVGGVRGRRSISLLFLLLFLLRFLSLLPFLLFSSLLFFHMLVMQLYRYNEYQDDEAGTYTNYDIQSITCAHFRWPWRWWHRFINGSAFGIISNGDKFRPLLCWNRRLITPEADQWFVTIEGIGV